MLKDKDNKPFVELFGLEIVESKNVPAKTMIVIDEIPKAKMQEFKSVSDVLEYLLDKEQVLIVDAKNKIGRGFRDIGRTETNRGSDNRDTTNGKAYHGKNK